MPMTVKMTILVLILVTMAMLVLAAYLDKWEREYLERKNDCNASGLGTFTTPKIEEKFNSHGGN
jgi:hypothetical protein